MKNLIFILLPTLLFANNTKFEVDNSMTSDKTKANFVSGKIDSTRFYEMKRSTILNTTLTKAMASILNYDQKCNNEYKDRRKFMDKKVECKYHNVSLIESKIHRLKDKKFDKEYAIERRIYNRDFFSHVDLVTVTRKKNQVFIKQRMLSNEEAKAIIKNPVEKKSAFLGAGSHYTLTQMGKNKVKVEFKYNSKTDHWLLNKSMVTSRVFNSIDESVELLFQSIKTHVAQRVVASTARPQKI